MSPTAPPAEPVLPPPAVPKPLVHLRHPDDHIPGYELPESASPPATRRQLAVVGVAAVAVAFVGFYLEHATRHVEDAVVPAGWVLPFVLLLASIATMPFVARHFWEHHYHQVAMGLGGVVAAYYLLFVPGGPGNIGRSASEYVSFIFLLGSLFVVSGGILIRVRAKATPMANATLLLIGAVIANVFGTTGASMLLIRPFLRMNKGHLKPYHVVFFIFVVSNAGGSLTPIGDPPLFLGYLMGVPFFWVIEHCWPVWAVVNGLLLAVFLVLDFRTYKGEQRNNPDGDEYGPGVSLYGATNLLFVTLILAGIMLHNDLNAWSHRVLHFEAPWRELFMAAAVLGSLATTPVRIHGGNRFNYAPIKEVAYLFVGIFLTMVPALNYLYHNAKDLNLTRPGQYYFASGSLSSVLDNAPTYLTFLKANLGTLDATAVERVAGVVKKPGHDLTAETVDGLDGEQTAAVRNALAALNRYHGDRVEDGSLDKSEIRVGFLVGDQKLNRYLIGISMGAVLFGAMTYIGNGPNFMVKSIADHAGAETPGFFRYIYAFSLPVLLPILVLVWLLFLT